MLKLTYAAVISLLINGVTAGDNTEPGDTECPVASNTLPVYQNTPDQKLPEDEDPEDLAFLAWGEKRVHTQSDEEDVTDCGKCKENCQFVIYANLLEPYMKKRRSAYTDEQKKECQEILAQIGNDFKLIATTERYKITQQLNILAILKGELVCFQKKCKRRNSTHEKITCTLADKFRVGKNRRNPMQLQRAQIEGGMTTAEEAALTLFDEWEKDGVLDRRVKSCKRRLKNNGFYRYQWPEYELVALLTHRSAYPTMVKKSMYSENKIQKSCKMIRKKTKHKCEYIENIALLLANKWRSQGILNEALADCVEKVTESKVWLA